MQFNAEGRLQHASCGENTESENIAVNGMESKLTLSSTC